MALLQNLSALVPDVAVVLLWFPGFLSDDPKDAFLLRDSFLHFGHQVLFFRSVSDASRA